LTKERRSITIPSCISISILKAIKGRAKSTGKLNWRFTWLSAGLGMFVLIGLGAFIIFLPLVAFLWLLRTARRAEVPLHSTEINLRRLEVQDRLRQTKYQVLTAAYQLVAAVALGATFLATMIQFGTTTQQWAADYELKSAQERLTQYTEAIKTVGKDSPPTAQISGITTLQLLGVQDPERFHHRVSEVLTQFIADLHSENKMTLSSWCGDDSISSPPYDLDQAPPALKAAVKAIGHPQFAAHRLNYSVDKCNLEKQSIDRGRISLENMKLDNLDLSGRDFSCAKMLQSQFRRNEFFKADLRGADLRRIDVADSSTPGFPTATIGNKIHKEADGGALKRRAYRCWIADFRYAKLQDANLMEAKLAGADFRWADFSGANLCGADLSRANFSAASGLSAAILADACVGPRMDKDAMKADPKLVVDEENQPVGIASFGEKFRIPRCALDKSCVK
jgi:Pentapeptide repeats (8 copies)